MREIIIDQKFGSIVFAREYAVDMHMHNTADDGSESGRLISIHHALAQTAPSGCRAFRTIRQTAFKRSINVTYGVIPPENAVYDRANGSIRSR